MSFASWSEFWEMGGYAFYVWSSYGATFLLLVANVWIASQRLRRIKQVLRRREDVS